MAMEIGRRDVLHAFLGACAATTACARSAHVPDGELAEDGHAIGHRVRDLAVDSLRPASTVEREVVVVGGGVAGVVASWRLRRAGLRSVLLVELHDDLGGTARSGFSPLSSHPWGAHYVTEPGPDARGMRALLADAGVLDGERGAAREEHSCRDTQERLFFEGEWHAGIYPVAGEQPHEREELARFRRRIDELVARRDARGHRAFALPLSSCAPDSQLDDLDTMTLTEWLDREGLRSARLRWLLDYACRDDFGLRASQASAWAGVHYFASRQVAPGSEPQDVLTWPGGNGWLVAQLARRASPELWSRAAVVDVAERQGGARVLVLDREGQLVEVRARRVIVAAPRHVAGRIVRARWNDERLAAVPGESSSWLVANLWLRQRPAGPTLAWDNVIFDGAGLGYVVATHQRGLDHGPTVLTYYQPLCDDNPVEARRRLLAADRRELADVALTDLERAHPDLRRITSRVDVMRWGHAMPRPVPGRIRAPGRARLAASHGAIHFAHTDLSGLALFEEAADHGLRAAEEVLTALGRPLGLALGGRAA